MNVLKDLNQQQRQAVECQAQPTLIVAGPGTGKTKTLTARIAYLLLSGRATADQILALTFTVKAAAEMKARVGALVGERELPSIATFHALGYRILSQQHGELAFIDETARLALIRGLARPEEFKAMTVRELSLLISRAKGSGALTGPVAHLVQHYNNALKQQGLVDYDDLLFRTHHLLAQDTQVRQALQARYQHVLIDEFQDTSPLQWELVQQVRGSDSVFAIGDPKQSIYGFRGAGGDMFERFRWDLPSAQQITLTTNYRSAGAIVSLANAVFPQEADLAAFSSQVGQVRALQTLNDRSEADLVLDIVEQGIGGSDLLKAGESDGRRFRDFAVLYRTHHAARTVQRRLYDSGIPVQVVGEGSPYEQPDVQAVVNSLRWAAGRPDVPAVKGWSEAQVRAVLSGVGQDQPVSALARAIAQALGFGSDPAGKTRLNQLVSTLVRFDDRPDGLEACVAYLDEISQGDFYDPQADAVTLMTIHASKGLEFPHVILIAAEEGILPHQRKTAPTDYDEERRLFYVAVTRAKDKLDIIYTKKRAGQQATPSRFVTELSNHILPHIVDPHAAQLEKKIQRRQQKARQGTLF